MRWQTLLLVPLLYVTACSGTAAEDTTVRPLGDPDATTTSTTSPPPPTSTTAAPTTPEPDPWAIPTTPDAAYFERVLNEHERALSQAIRLAYDKGTVDAEVADRLEALSTGVNYEYNVESLTRLLGRDERLLTLEASPSVKIVELSASTLTCALLVATISFDGVYFGEREAGLIITEVEWATPSDLNPTGWRVVQRWDVGNEPEISCSDS